MIGEGYYNRFVKEFGEDVATNIFSNLNGYLEKMESDKSVYKIFKDMKEQNKLSLRDIHISGDYFNNKDSSYYSSKDGYLVLEDVKSKLSYKTQIRYEHFKEYVSYNLDDIAEALVYINTNDNEQMNRLAKFDNCEILFASIFENSH